MPWLLGFVTQLFASIHICLLPVELQPHHDEMDDMNYWQRNAQIVRNDDIAPMWLVKIVLETMKWLEVPLSQRMARVFGHCYIHF